MIFLKRIGLKSLLEKEIAQPMREVDLVERSSHLRLLSIVNYEGMDWDKNTLSIVLECVLPIFSCLRAAAAHSFPLAHK